MHSRGKKAWIYLAAFCVWYVATNMIFGWNQFPESTVERLTDLVSIYLICQSGYNRLIYRILEELNGGD